MRKLVVAVYAGNRSVCHTKYTNTALTTGLLWTVKKKMTKAELIKAIQTLPDDIEYRIVCQNESYFLIRILAANVEDTERSEEK